MNLDKDTKTLFFDVGQTFPAVTNLLHRYNCIVIHVSSNHTNFFQRFSIFFNLLTKVQNVSLQIGIRIGTLMKYGNTDQICGTPQCKSLCKIEKYKTFTC